MSEPFIPPSRRGPIPRREFLRRGGLVGAAAALLPGRLLADPYEPYRIRSPQRRPVRIQGVVRAGGRGVGRVAVTDGIRIVDTADDGTFDFISSTAREHVYVSLPSGYRIPTNPMGKRERFPPVAGSSTTLPSRNVGRRAGGTGSPSS